MKIDLNKTYRTKAGHDVQIFTTGAPEPYPVVGIWKEPESDVWIAESWAITGAHWPKDGDSLLDLVEVKPKRLVYVNLYSCSAGRNWTKHATKEDAVAVAISTAVAVAVPVYIEEEE